MMKFTIRGIIGFTALLVIISIYRAAHGDWSGLALFGLYLVLVLLVAIVAGVIYFISYRKIMKKIYKR